MSLLTINLNLKPEYKELLDDFIKFTSILLILHILLSISTGKNPSDLGLIGELFNEDIINIFIYLVISFYIYHMIVKKLITIN